MRPRRGSGWRTQWLSIGLALSGASVLAGCSTPGSGLARSEIPPCPDLVWLLVAESECLSDAHVEAIGRHCEQIEEIRR